MGSVDLIMHRVKKFDCFVLELCQFIVPWMQHVWVSRPNADAACKKQPHDSVRVCADKAAVRRHLSWASITNQPVCLLNSALLLPAVEKHHQKNPQKTMKKKVVG